MTDCAPAPVITAPRIAETMAAPPQLWGDPRRLGNTFEPWNEKCDYTFSSDAVTRVLFHGRIWRLTADSSAGTEPGLIPDPGGVRPWELDQHAEAEYQTHVGAVEQATWVLDTLTGRRLHGVGCWIEDYRLRSCRLHLRRGPVVQVDQVERVRDCGSDVSDVLDFCIEDRRTINVCGPCGCGSPGFCGCDDNVFRVRYKVGSNLPPGTGDLVLWLARQYLDAMNGKSCALPDRITSVSRQGVSWTMLDPMDFLDKGLMGVGRIDQFISTVRRDHGVSRIVDPMKGVLLNSVSGPCGGEFGDQDTADPLPDPFSFDFRTRGANPR